mgnify:CR=1 FL=1
MDYEENVFLDPVTATVLDQNFSILVTVAFPWGTEAVAQSIDVAYTEEQKLASSGSRWTAEFGYTFLPGSPLRADNSHFTIMTLKGGYSDAEVADAKNTIEDTSSALSSARTIPMVLIGVALVSLMGGFYVYYQNNQGGDMSSGMDESASEESAPSMAVTEEDSEEGKCGILKKAMYGTRDAAQNWEVEYNKFMASVGFKRGVTSPCTFWNEEKDTRVVVHGDDFTISGVDEDLIWIRDLMASWFEIKVRGVLGDGPNDVNEISDAMSQIDNDSKLSKKLILKGQKKIHKFKWDVTANVIHQVLLKYAN